ncbi:MAG: LysM peptidoglycan-binding domain-containing protein [Bacteroidota bacterium]
MNPYSERKVLVQNGVQYIVARKGDDLKSLSEEFRLGYWQLPKYNEMKFSSTLAEGQVVYLQPKKREGAYATYSVKEGDTVQSISQATAMKSKFIREYNGLTEESRLTPGTTLKLVR